MKNLMSKSYFFVRLIYFSQNNYKYFQEYCLFNNFNILK